MRTLALVLAFLLSAAYPTSGLAAALAQAGDGRVRVILYDESCTLPGLVTNLPQRAEWIEGATRYEGCWNVNPDGIVSLFFTDKSVVSVPAQAFKPATSV